MDSTMVLYYLSSAAGLVMVVGGIWLIYKEKIFIDRESKQPIEIRLPFGSFKSNYPALALFVLGFFPLVYPVYKLNPENYVRVKQVKIKGLVETDAYPALVYAARGRDFVLNKEEGFHIPVPFLGQGDEDYKVLLIVNDHVLGEAVVAREPGSHGDIEVKFKPVSIEPLAYETKVEAVPEKYK